MDPVVSSLQPAETTESIHQLSQSTVIKIRFFDLLPYISTKGSNETPYKG